MNKKYLIGTDIGTSSTKSVMIDEKGNVIAKSISDYLIDVPKKLYVEQWPNIWLDAVCKTIFDVMKQSKVCKTDVLGLCISSLYGGSGVPCDENMNPVRPCIIWMDRRAQKESLKVERKIGRERLFKITGNSADSYFGFAKILWIKENEPENWEKIKLFLPPNSYVVYHLTKEIAIDYTSMGNLGGIYNIKEKNWSFELMSEIGIPNEVMPKKILKPEDIVGGLTKEAARKLGLLEGTPLCMGSVDCLAANLSAGVLKENQHVAVLGTSVNWGVVHCNELKKSELISMPYIINPEKLIYTYGGASTAGALPKWFCDNFVKVDEKDSEKSIYEILDNEAENIKEGSLGLIILPYFMGERSPIWDVNAKGTIFGLTLHHNRAHVYRAILESVAYSLRHIIESFDDKGKYLKECIIVGGGVKSKVWKQIFADVLGMVIVCKKGNIEAPLGDAIVAGVATGVFDDYSIVNDIIDDSEKTYPNQKSHKIYCEYFKQYKALYKSLKKNMKELSKLSDCE